MCRLKNFNHIVVVASILACSFPFATQADVDFVPEADRVDSRVVIRTNTFARDLEFIFIDENDEKLTSYFAAYFFKHSVDCAPVSAISSVDGVITRWLPKTSVADILDEKRLKIENTDEMIEALFDAEELEVMLINQCGDRTVYKFDLKGYERAMRKLGIE